MNKILSSAFGAAVGAIGLAACDAAAPPDAAVSRPVEPEAITTGETLVDVVREALADIVRDDDAYARARRLGALLPTLGPELVPAVKDTLADPTVDLGATEIELLVRFWATHQPEDASRWAVEKSPTGYRIAAVLSALPLWAEADPQAATIAAQEWSQRRDVRGVLPIALVRGWYAANDPPELTQFIRDAGMGFGRQIMLSPYLRAKIQKQGADAAARWAESVPDDDAVYKLAVYRQVGSVMSLLDHEAAMRWCEAHCDGPHGKDLRSIIARRWVQWDGPAAFAWLSNAPEGYATNFAVRVAFDVWGRVDREAALAWMAAQTTGEPDPWLRPAFTAYAKLLAQDSPADAIEWAERVEDDEEREYVLIRLARAWREVDEAATEAWLVQSSLSEEARENVRAKVWNRRPKRNQAEAVPDQAEAG